MNYTDEQVALCALNKVFGFEPVRGRALMEEAGSALAVFSRPGETGPDGTPLDGALLDWARRELAAASGRGYRFLALTDEDYPAALLECPDPPLGLYLSACSQPAEIFELHPLIGIVGTRDISPYGREWDHKIVEALSQARIPVGVVSGLAYGADAIAHRAALSLGLPTIGVMATGIDSIYPWRHGDLAREMAGSPGSALITDYPMGTSPVALNFIRRNRLIAGLSRAVIVIESKSKGGSLMTARYAVDYGRDVFALPGRVDDLRSAGCNSLISNSMAQIITSVQELMGQLGLGARVRGAGGSWATGPLTQDRFRRLLEQAFGAASPAVAVGLAVQACRGLQAEELAARTGLPIGAVMEGIGLLEARGFIVTDLLRRCALAQAYA